VRVRRRVVGAAACAIALAACGGGSHHASRSTTVADAGRTATPAPTPTPTSTPTATATRTTINPHPHPRVPRALIRLRASLRKTLRQAGPGVGVAVYDLTTHAWLFTLHERTRRPPASVEKLYTTLALLHRLGPTATLKTRVLSSGHLGPHGTWHGDLYLTGGGDPTLGDGAFNRIWEGGHGPTATELARTLVAAGIKRVKGRIIGDESLFDTLRAGPSTGFAPDLPDFGGELSALTYDHGSTLGHVRSPAAFAARALARTLRAMHVKVKASPGTGRAPSAARVLATVDSPPLSVLLRLMDVPSDDLFAEMLTKQLGARFDRAGSIAAGARVIGRTIADVYHLHPSIVDGSGLSRDDRSSPLDVVDLLRQIWRTPAGKQLADALPVVGVNGTVRRIGGRTPAAGRCLAKTGTLNNVTNLAGYCHSRGHQEVAFALFVDGPPNWTATPMMSQLVGAIAAY
jgi:serine-type D-Ala-D-Ala carboxypeptidase/endopeptidase (penicillin-binding protein 4)